MTTLLPLISLEKGNYRLKISFTAILPKVILKMMNTRERLRYGSTLE